MESDGFRFALPFDPFRLLLAILEKFGLILLAGVICGALGVGFAVLKLGNTYSATIELVTEGWQGGPAGGGSVYEPMPITGEAVMIAAKAEQVFELAAERLSSGVGSSALRPLVKMEQLPGEGLFSVSAKTGDGREETLQLVTVYVEALMDYTAQVRRDAAQDQYELLERQVQNKTAVAGRIDRTIIEYAEKKGILDLVGTSAQAVAELTQLKNLLSEAERDLKTNNDIVLSYIRKDLVAALNLQLADLLAAKSDVHPLVLGKKQEIRAVEEQIELSSISGKIDMKDFETLLPPNVYFAVQRLKEGRQVLENKIANYRERLAQSESEMGGLPERSLEMTKMAKIRDQAIAASVVLRGQMNDAEFFAKNAPPGLSIFHAPLISEVKHKSLIFKAIILAVLGFFGGAGAVIGISLLRELLGRQVRTPMQAAIAAGAYPKLVYPPSHKTPNDIALRNFWIRGVARFLPGERRMIFPVVGEIPNEIGFWSGLFESLQGEAPRIVFVDFSVEPLDLELPEYDGSNPVPISRVEPSQYAGADFNRMVASFPEDHVLIIRWDMNPTSVLAELAPHIDRQYILTSQEVSLSRVEEESRNYRDVFGDADGLVLVNSRRPRRSQIIVNRLQDWYLEGYRRKSLRGAIAPIAH